LLAIVAILHEDSDFPTPLAAAHRIRCWYRLLLVIVCGEKEENWIWRGGFQRGVEDAAAAESVGAGLFGEHMTVPRKNEAAQTAAAHKQIVERRLNLGPALGLLLGITALYFGRGVLIPVSLSLLLSFLLAPPMLTCSGGGWALGWAPRDLKS
jgi:hypothetical protein